MRARQAAKTNLCADATTAFMATPSTWLAWLINNDRRAPSRVGFRSHGRTPERQGSAKHKSFPLQGGKPSAYAAARQVAATMKIAIGSDHAGFKYKEAIKQVLAELGHEALDVGTDSEDPVDYPAFIRPVAEAVAKGQAERGIVLGGSGNGEAIVANRVKGVRCALCWSDETARWGRE